MEEEYLIPTNINKKNTWIKVIGVGGGGCNAVTQMYRQGIQNVDFIICNTDAQTLNESPVPIKVQLGNILTRGLGAGCDPERGKMAAIESIEEIKRSIGAGTEMVFITAGLGGGTGTGAAPVIADITKNELGLLTIGVVTLPFKDEGMEFYRRAMNGLKEISSKVDSLLVIDNQKLYEIYADLNVADAFPKVDEVLNTAVKGIAEIITSKGFINVDLADVKMVTKDSGIALLGIGTASGEDRAKEAVRLAFESPLLNEYNLRTATNALVNISCNKNSEHNLTMAELEQIMAHIQDYTGPTEKFKRGVVYDDTLENDTIRITVVVTGIDMTITPQPQPTQVYRDDTTIVTLSEREDENDGSITLPLSYEPGNFQQDEDPHYDLITVYDGSLSIMEYEKEPALTRLKKKIEAKNHK
ncbi:MAG: cell division protein FtsZ [Bacteroidales bacterium]|nr:cell division protein FtsZ [Bacteroidales bacterium]